MSTELFDLTGTTAVVTGGGRGIGRGVTESLLAAGAAVVVLQRHDPPADLYDFARERGRSLAYVPLDLAEGEQVEDVAAAVLDRYTVDILVNNAGAQFRSPAADFPLERFDEILQVNLRASFRLCQIFGRPMLGRSSGKIVNIASLLSFQGGLTVPAYAASKGGVAQVTKALANEWASRGVNVNAVAPGYMTTDLNEALVSDAVRYRQVSERIPAGRWGTAGDVGGAVVFLCSAAAAYVHGVVLPVDGGWLAR